MTFSQRDLIKMISQVGDALQNSEGFLTGELANRAKQAAETYPNDPTLIGMYNFLNKRADSQAMISRAELKSAYQRLYSRNTRCGQVFAEELNQTPQESTVKTASRHPEEGTNLLETAYSKHADPVLANALSVAFDKNASYKPYSAEIGKLAARVCLHELNCLIPPKKIDVVAGQADVLLCNAIYETPKGSVAVLIPIEIKSGKALLPSVFLTRLGFADLTKEALQDHIIDCTGKSFQVDAQKVLQVVAAAKGTGPKQISEVDMIVAKAKAAQGQEINYLTPDGFLYQEIDQVNANIETPVMPESEEFGKRLASPAGGAEFLFGKFAVDAGRKFLAQSMQAFGYKRANINVLDADKDTVYYAVSLDNKAAFKVPMKVAGGKIQQPSFILANGMHDFSAKAIGQILASAEGDSSTMAAASPAYGGKSSELIEQVYTSMLDGNLSKAEDALIVLQTTDEVAYKTAFAIFKDGLSGKLIKEASAGSQCTMQRKVAHSKHVLCGHTNLPLHKVYQDKQGDCLPLYRKHSSEPAGASFMHSKVYFG